MRKYLIHTEKNGENTGALITVPVAEWSSEDFGAVQTAFAREFGSEDYATMTRLDEFDRTNNGLYFDWGLAGPGGAWFTVIAFPEHSRTDVKNAKQELRSKRDVVRMNHLRIHNLVEWDPAKVVVASSAGKEN